MSDEWFYHGSQRRSSGGWMPLLVAILLITNVGVVAYTTIHSNDQVQVLNDKIGTLTTSVQILNAEVSSANAEISSLKETLQSGAVNVTVSSGASDALLIDLYNKTRDSVVLITVKLTGGTAQGSGFVYNTTGLIVTNYHVVEDALSITVTFIDGTIVDATVVGTDPYSDVAVIKVTAPISMLKPLKLGDSSKLKVGESIVAIGNPYGLANTLTSGIISAVGRQMDSTGNYPIVDVIQMDAAINPGNSGGPLLNMAGEVVGINTAIPTETSRGIGFAIPSNTITRELPSLLSKGTYVHPYLGITGQDLTPSLVDAMNLPTGTHGTLVITVTNPGPSYSAGLKGSTRTITVDGESVQVGGDVILGADGTQMKSFYDLIVYIQRNKKPGDTVTLNILRNGSNMNVAVTLGTRPPP
ncbi:MAG: trypsin-like peptidase domain-containing protein [Candidatus Bathyarchaeota archaeon]|nr:trypsin-like peptidase domain-containing protein [Candidatus Bathyarchaeota archaeon]